MRVTVRLMLESLIRGAIKELKEQGHVASGEGIKSFEPRILQPSPNFYIGQVLVNEYVMKLDKKQPPTLVDLSDLIKWANYVRRGITGLEKLSFALRVQRSIATVGVPSPGSFRFSTNKRRTGWVEYGAKNSEKEMNELIQDSDYVETLLNMAVDEAIRGS